MQREEHTSGLGKLRQKWRSFMEFKTHVLYLWRKEISSERSHFFNGERNVYFHNIGQSNHAIGDLIKSGKPVMIARHGGNEIKVAANFDTENKISYVNDICFNAGFFPQDEQLIGRWAQLYLDATRDLDFLCEWNYRYGRFNEAQHVFGKYSPNAMVGNDINVLTPFSSSDPWTKSLEGKRVLVIHPFTETIQNQYEKRKLLHKHPQFLPEFASLETITAVQTVAGNPDPRFSNWFEAYDYLCAEISKRDFDVALIGCGCYGLILASYVKTMGKSAVHMGGALQLLFGIRGKRWDNAQDWIEQGVFNEHWVRPSEDERPKQAAGIEGGCYW